MNVQMGLIEICETHKLITMCYVVVGTKWVKCMCWQYENDTNAKSRILWWLHEINIKSEKVNRGQADGGWMDQRTWTISHVYLPSKFLVCGRLTLNLTTL